VIKKSLLFFLVIFLISLQADFKNGEKIFNKKCSSCHSAHIPMKDLKDNFFSKKNKVLNLKYPTVNMLAYALVDSPKHIGDKDDPEMQQVEIEEFISSYLENPDLNNSICDDHVSKYYVKKEKVDYKLSSEDISSLSIYFMNYKKNRLAKKPIIQRVLSNDYNEKDLLQEAKDTNKRIMIYATSKSCYFCKKMDKNVFSLNEVKEEINKDFIFLKVDIEDVSLPFNLNKGYRGMTPTFFALDENAKLINKYPGSWTKDDFLLILKENINEKISENDK
jgi:thioredoxin-related protein